MASRSRKPRPRSSGRVTPKGGPRPAPPSRPPARGRRPRPGIDVPAQVGRRPSSPLLLLAVGLMWVACGVIALVRLHAAWKFVPGVVFIGIGMLFLRGAATTVTRRAERESGE